MVQKAPQIARLTIKIPEAYKAGIKMNQAQFNYITAKLNIKPERLQAVTDVIFNGLTATPAESKHGLCRGVIQRDVNRVNDLYNWAIKLKGIR